MELDLENPLCSSHHHLPNHDDDSSSLFHNESAHLPSYFPAPDLFRRKTISLISHHSKSNSNPFLTYLAINYLDRFICLQNTQNWKPWTVNLVAVSCISLALKMTRTDSTSSVPNQDQDDEDGGSILVFDRKTIQRMELVILGALKWRMRSITPFSFITFFISLFNLKDPSSLKLLRDRATQIIFRSQMDESLMGFKPSTMAASSLLAACHELFPLQFPCFRNSICQSSYVDDKDSLMNCYGVMQETENGGGDGGRRTGSPVHMFDRRVWSTSSSETEMEAETKRQKICQLNFMD
ncbi:putative cyclin-D6-1 [Impatiens glandulifera]|uniref:putative cyclin-D6-1 n=1 Tax=Impatiens glandulifera TaxID=253017 RepID=UPI001FB12B9C|nr:putative cyclin-D6-1 [Impatiens glandulifera]